MFDLFLTFRWPVFLHSTQFFHWILPEKWRWNVASIVTRHSILDSGKLDTRSTDNTSIQAIAERHVECLEVNLYLRNARFSLLFCEKTSSKWSVSLLFSFVRIEKSCFLAFTEFFLVLCRQNASRQLATSSENLVANAQFLVALATSESQFRALCMKFTVKVSLRLTLYL